MSLIDFRIFPIKKVVEIDAKHTMFKPSSLLEFFYIKEIPFDYRIRFSDLTVKNILKFYERDFAIIQQDTDPSIELEIE